MEDTLHFAVKENLLFTMIKLSSKSKKALMDSSSFLCSHPNQNKKQIITNCFYNKNLLIVLLV